MYYDVKGEILLFHIICFVSVVSPRTLCSHISVFVRLVWVVKVGLSIWNGELLASTTIEGGLAHCRRMVSGMIGVGLGLYTCSRDSVGMGGYGCMGRALCSVNMRFGSMENVKESFVICHKLVRYNI